MQIEVIYVHIPFLLGASTGKLSQKRWHFFCGFMMLTTPTHISKLLIVRVLRPVNTLLPDWKPPTDPKIVPLRTRGKEWFLCSFVLTRWEMLQPGQTKVVLYPAKAAAMSTACPPPLIPPVLLAQNLSLKRILPTNNLQPKSGDAKKCHQWLKMTG